MIGAWTRLIFPVHSGLPLKAFIVPHLVSLQQPVLRKVARPSKFTAREQLLLYDDGYASPCPFYLENTVSGDTVCKLPFFYVNPEARGFTLRVLFSQSAYEANVGVFREGTRYHMLA